MAIGGGLGWIKLLKNGAGKGFIFHAIISALYPFWLVKLKKYFYTRYAWISIMKKQKGKQILKYKMMVIFVKTFNHYNHKFNFGNSLSCSVKLKKNLKLKFRLKFNHTFTNHGYLQSPVWKTLYNFKIKRAQNARNNQFLFQNVWNNEIFEILKLFKNNRWININYQKANACISWSDCSAFDWKYLFLVNLIQKMQNCQFKLKFDT